MQCVSVYMCVCVCVSVCVCVCVCHSSWWETKQGTHLFSLFIDRNTAVYFDSLEIEYIPQELIVKTKDKFITQNIFRIKSDDSIACGFYCINFIEYLLAGETLSNCTNLLLPNNYKKNEK